MAVRRGLAPSGSGASTDGRDAVIVAEGISKQYPRVPVRLFPPIVSMFQRDWFPLRRSSRPLAGAEVEEERAAAAQRSHARSRRREYELDYDDLDDDEDDEDDEDEDDLEGGAPRVAGPTPDRPGEMFWALRDVSFRVAPGQALGVLGGPDSGKTTLLNILGGRAFPTEGRVLTRGRVAPMPADLAKALVLSGKGFFDFDLVMGSRLMGLHPHQIKRHRDEIEALAEPVLGPDGEPAPGAMARLAVATAVTVPADAILIEDGLRGTDGDFMTHIVERLHQRLRDGACVVFASRQPDTLSQVCDEVLVLEDGEVVRRGPVADAAGGYATARGPGSRADKTSPRPSGGGVRVHPVGAPFHESAALISAEVQAGDGARSKRIDDSEELSVVIHLETVLPDTEVRCGVCFVPRSGEAGVRVEHPDPLRLSDPGTYAFLARVPAGTLPVGRYKVHADAVVATGAQRDANAISRDAGRLRIVGEPGPPVAPETPPTEHWDGCVVWRAEADWSIG